MQMRLLKLQAFYEFHFFRRDNVPAMNCAAVYLFPFIQGTANLLSQINSKIIEVCFEMWLNMCCAHIL
jgi:hypothetical protein